MNLSDLSKSVSGILGKPEKAMGKAQLDALGREVAFLEREFSKLDNWQALRDIDKNDVFKAVISDKIASIIEQYHSVEPANLMRLQVQHTMLKEMLYAYENSGKAKVEITKQIKEKQDAYNKGFYSQSGK